jgi:hypothetical protein
MTATAAFELFVRRLAPTRGFLVAAGAPGRLNAAAACGGRVALAACRHSPCA